MTDEDYSRCIRAKFDENYFVSVPRESFYILFGTVTMGMAYPAMIRVPMKIDLNPDDRAVYIGTVRFHRDEYFNIKKVEIIDELNSIRADFQKMFGNSLQVRKVIPAIVQIKEDEVKKEDDVKLEKEVKKNQGGAQKMF